MTTSKQLIAYWRDSLTDAELAALELTEGNHVQVFSDALAEGTLDTQSTAALFAQSKQPIQLRDEPANIPVIVVPIVAVKAWRDGRQRLLCPLLIPAELDSNGCLQAPIGYRRPWIPRILLEPTSSDLVLGNVDWLDDFFAHHFRTLSAEEAAKDWADTFNTAWQMLRHVTNGQGQQIVEESGFRISDKAAVVSMANVWGMTGNILHVYNHLLDRQKIPPLLENYLTLTPPAPKPALAPLDWIGPAQQHLGSFSNQFPLSPSQRQALHHFLSLENHSTLAVSGPPGTGKTTLLHSVIASLWVKAALYQRQPPVIVATSTNNQAVTNVIDSLAGADGVPRWLPVSSFGLYLVNMAIKQADAAGRGLLTLNKKGGGFPAQAETADFVSQAKEQYLAACSRFLEREVVNIAEGVQHLHQRLKSKAADMVAGMNIAFRLNSLTQQVTDLAHPYGTLAAYENSLQQQVNEAQKEQGKWRNIRQAWLQYQQAEPTFYSVLGFVPGIRRKQVAGYQLFLAQNMPDTAVAPDPSAISAMIDNQVENANAAVNETARVLQEVQQLTLKREALLTQWQQWREKFAYPAAWEQLFQLENEAGETLSENLLNWLDTTFRHDLFVLATHYWEGRWLQEVEKEQLSSPDFKEARNRASQEKRWRRYAMLTPCFVTTMHTGPSFFDYYDRKNKPLLGTIDLLIIDEAGQVTPEVSGAMLALAKQALVVGDVKQIEPVWSIHHPVDLGNLQRHNLALTEEELTGLQARGLMASSGSVMQIAQQVSPYQIPADNGVVYERGMFLAEHRRCVPEIIGYCNTLAYNGRLRPLRPSLTHYPWPHLGYVHVKGDMAFESGSRRNEREAQALAAWIADNQAAFIAHYGRPLDDVLGIVTPFAAQKRALLRALNQRGLELSKVGTVHALQGGERPIVLFSPVYTTQDADLTYFFDRGPNMLNVAVSRARDSFIVFGDMDIFNPAQATPSGILARYLFACEANEMVGFAVPERGEADDETAVHHIRTLDKHVRALKRAFDRAQRRLDIVSPFLRWRAVEQDRIGEQTRAAVARGVEVNIYIDQDFNENLTLPAAVEAATALRESGAQVHICRNIHSKVVCVDNEVFIEGSFNWLSAERSIADYTRYETSIIYTGPMAATFIEETLADIQQRIINETGHVQRT